jgi:hypothetical protein
MRASPLLVTVPGSNIGHEHFATNNGKMMKIKRLIRSTSVLGVGVLLMAASAQAGVIVTFTTNAAGSEFAGGITGDILDSTSGQFATLTFTPDTSSDSGLPSGIDLGDFLLVCSTCTTSQDTIFGSFTFDLIVTDKTDNATGEFVATSSGGTVSSNSSTIQIDWTMPIGLQVGPGTSNTLSGNFNLTDFDIVSPITLVVAPNSGTPPGDTRVQGQINSTPEPPTFVLIGAALFGLGMIPRKKAAHH